MRPWGALVVCSLIAVARLPSANAYCIRSFQGYTKQAAWKKVVPYKISDAVTDPKILAAIDAAFQTWGSVPCSALKFSKSGTFPQGSTPFEHNEYAIYVFWYPSATGYPTDPKYAAFTFLGHDNFGGLVRGSIALNGFNSQYKWATDGSATALDVQNEVTALIGQVLGFGESTTPGSVMFPGLKFGDTSKRKLSQDDINAVLYLYKDAGCAAPPAPAGNCPGGTPPPPGDGGVTPKTDGGGTGGRDGGGGGRDGGVGPRTEAGGGGPYDGAPPAATDGTVIPLGDGGGTGGAGDGGGGCGCEVGDRAGAWPLGAGLLLGVAGLLLSRGRRRRR